jgi:transcriptional regulator with XRE-family HTH domain
MEDIHIGNQIKSVLESRGLSVTEFAKRINKSRENIYSIFTRKTIDTGAASEHFQGARLRLFYTSQQHPLRATGRTSSAQRRKPAVERLQQIVEKG